MSLSPSGSSPGALPNRGVRVAVVDGHTFMRELMCRQLSRHNDGYFIVADAATAAGATTACKAHKPDLLVLDINLPDRSGISAVPEIRRVSPRTRILLCTAFPREDWITEATTCGADGFVEKTNTWNEFMTAVEQVSRGHRYFSAAGSRSQRAPQKPATAVRLTTREQQILKLISNGLTTKEIAARLFISVPTVETHRAKLMTKTGTRNVAGLVRFAVESGHTSS